MRAVRWAMALIALAMVTAMTAPTSAYATQASAASGEGVLAMVPGSALAYGQINLDPTSDQMVLASALFERAGLGNPVEEMSAEEDFPGDATVGMVVTSIPETDDIELNDVTVDPAIAADALDEGGFSVIVQTASYQQVYDEMLEEMHESLEMSGGEIIESEYGGIAITARQPGADDDYTDPSAIAIVGETVVMATRAEDLEPIIDTFNGDTSSLADDENYQAVAALLPAESIASGYANGPAVLAALEQASPDEFELADPRTTALLNSWAGFALTAEQDGFRIVSKAIASDGAFEPAAPLDGSFFDMVRSDAILAINGTNIDGTGTLTMLAFLAASEFVGEDLMATPAAEIDIEAAQDQVFSQAEQMLGFNLKTDLIDHLNGEFGLTVSVSDFTSDVPSVNALIVTHVDDIQSVSDAMDQVAMIVGAALGDQTLVGEKPVGDAVIASVDISDTGMADSIDFGVVGDDLVIGVGSGVDDYANGAAEPMSQDPNFIAVMEHLPAEYTSATYINMPAVMTIVMGVSGGMGGDITDADPSCGDYASQEEAQAVYDEDQFENYQLDQDYDGEACEDYFAPAAATPAVDESPYQNVLGLGIVTSLDGDVYTSETFLMIGGE